MYCWNLGKFIVGPGISSRNILIRAAVQLGFYRISGYRILSGRIWLFAGYPDNPDPVFFCRIIRIRQCRIIRQLPIQGGKKIKEQHILGGGTFFCTRSVQNYIAQEARENFSRPSGVFHPPPRAKMFLI